MPGYAPSAQHGGFADRAAGAAAMRRRQKRTS